MRKEGRGEFKEDKREETCMYVHMYCTVLYTYTVFIHNYVVLLKCGVQYVICTTLMSCVHTHIIC